MPSMHTLRVLGAVLILGTVAVGAALAGAPTAGSALPHESPEEPDGTVTVLRGNGSLFTTLDSPEAVRRAETDDRLWRTDRLTVGEVLVLRFRSDRVTDRFADTAGENATDRFFRLLNTSAVNLSVEGRNHGTERLPTSLALNRSNVRVLHDSANGTVVLLVDTGNVSLVDRADGSPVQRTLAHTEFEAVVEIPAADTDRRVLVGGAAFVPPTATLQSRDASATLGVTPATIQPNATASLALNGSTSLLPGSTLTVRAVTPNGTTLAASRVRTRAPNRTDGRLGNTVFEATLRLGSLDASSEFDLLVTRGERMIAERRVVVGTPPRMWNTTATLVRDGPNAGLVAVNATLRLPDAGFLLVYVDGDPVTKSVPGDQTVRKTVYVNQSAIDEEGEVYVLAVWDRNDNGVYDPRPDRLFRTSADVGASAQDDELDTTAQVTGWPPETPTATPTVATGPTTAPSPGSPDSSETTTPGFGWVGTIGALGAVLLFAWRRITD